jgi:two-component sensor histidine kinase
MSLLNERLHHSEGSHDLDLGAYLCSVAKDLLAMQSSQIEGLDVNCQMDEVMVSPREAIPCGLIVNELISNALKHAFVSGDQDSPQIDVRLIHASEGLVQLQVEDNGCGFPEGYRQTDSKSLGMRLVYMLGEDQLGGQIKISNKEGASFLLSFFPEGNESVKGE